MAAFTAIGATLGATFATELGFSTMLAGALAGGAAGLSLAGQMRAADAQEEQIKLQKKQTEMSYVKQLQEQARTAYRMQARVASAGAQSGTMGSTGVLGGVASVQSQAANQIGYSRDTWALQQQQIGAAMDYAGGQAMMGWGSALGTIGGAYDKYHAYTQRQMTNTGPYSPSFSVAAQP